MNRGIWLGFFFLVALVLVGFATLLIRADVNPFRPYHRYTVNFDRVQGLRAGDDVRMDGVQIGKVEEIRLNANEGVDVAIRLDVPLRLFSDGEIQIESTSVLGGGHVSIRRGRKPPEKDLSLPILGRAQPGLDEIGKMVEENRENFQELIRNLKDVTQAMKDGPGTVNKLLKSPEAHDSLVATLKKADEALAEFKKVGEKVNERLSSERIDEILGNVANATDTFRGTAEKVDKLVQKVDAVVDKVNTGKGTLGTLLNDPEIPERLKRITANVEQTSESLRNLLQKTENGDNSVGRLLQDDELYEKAKQTLDDLDKVLAKPARALVEVTGESKYYPDSEMQISKMGLRLSPSEDKYFEVGAAFLGLDKKGEILFKSLVEDDRNDTVIKPEVLVAYRVPWFLDHRLTVRGGLIEGKPGGAVDFVWDDWGIFHHPFKFTFEIRDAYNSVDREDIDEQLRGPLMRASFKTPLWTRKDSWFELILSTIKLYAGVNRIGANGEAMVGIGLEWPDDDLRTLVGFIGLAR